MSFLKNQINKPTRTQKHRTISFVHLYIVLIIYARIVGYISNRVFLLFDLMEKSFLSHKMLFFFAAKGQSRVVLCKQSPYNEKVFLYSEECSFCFSIKHDFNSLHGIGHFSNPTLRAIVQLTILMFRHLVQPINETTLLSLIHILYSCYRRKIINY